MRNRCAYASSTLLIVVGAILTQFPIGNTEIKGRTVDDSSDRRQRVAEAYGHLPLRFEVNQGQTDSQVKFLSRGRGYTMFLTANEAVLSVREGVDRSSDLSVRSLLDSKRKAVKSVPPQPDIVLGMNLVGANPNPEVTGENELPGKSNYFIGNDPAKWQTNVPQFSKVRYEDAYPGIDLVYYGNQGQLEYDFVIAPGAEPQQIRLQLEGARRLELDAEGDLLLHTAHGVLRQLKPVIYQEDEGGRHEIAGGYELRENNEVSFHISEYDRRQLLIIDPVLVFSTYLGGGDYDDGRAIAVDSSGNAYIAGATLSINFPTTSGVFQTTHADSFDAFVTKLNPTGSAVVYSTYLGGDTPDFGNSIAVDALGNAYVTGGTLGDFPTTVGAFQPAQAGIHEAFVTKLNPTGSALVYSTYIGGGSIDGAAAIAVDADGNASVAGQTSSADFPTTLGSFQTSYGGGPWDVFVSKLNSAGSALVYSTYLGGADDDIGLAIALDASGSAYATGRTFSSNFPTTLGAFQTSFAGSTDAFVTKLNTTGSLALYSTYLGGNGEDYGRSITVDSLGNAYLTGPAWSNNFPTTSGAFQTTPLGNNAFVTKVNPTASSLTYSTYLGGLGGEEGRGIAVDGTGNAYVTGSTTSADFPTVNPIQSSLGGGSDAYAAKLNSSGSELLYSTYLGGAGNDSGLGIALDSLPSPSAYVSGLTTSVDFPTTTAAFQTSFGGGSHDAFVAKLTDVVLPPPTSVGKVTGGGTIDVVGGRANFGFIVQAQSASGPIDGDLQYVNHATGDKVHSVAFSTFVIVANTVSLTGTCTNNGAPCTFSVEAQDNGEPGKDDRFTISISAGPTEGGTLRSGNIQIHN